MSVDERLVALSPKTALLSQPLSPAHSATSSPQSALSPSSSSSSSLGHSNGTDTPAKKASTAVAYDELLELAGTGAFHYQLLALCGWANAADAIEILAASFIMSSASDLDLDDGQKGWIGAMVFLGMLIGGWAWGSLADRVGRKPCLIIALLINAVGGALAAFSGTYEGLLACRFVAGLGVGGSIPVIFTYFIEFLPTSTRGQFMVYLAWFWMVGAVFTASAAWIVIPQSMDERTMFGLPFQSWRLFTLICAVPSLICSISMFFCPESPQFLMTQRRLTEAKAIVHSMYQVNHSNSSFFVRWFGLCWSWNSAAATQAAYAIVAPLPSTDETIKDVSTLSPDERMRYFESRLACLDVASSISLLDGDEERIGSLLDGEIDSEDERQSLTQHDANQSSGTWSMLRAIVVKTRALFTPEYLPSSIRLTLTWFGLSFGYYGITLWIPETLRKLKGDTNDGPSIYEGAFLAAACNLPGNIVSIWAVKRIGRAKTLGISIAISTIAIGLVPFADSTWSVTAVLSSFSLISVSAWNALNISTTELYPSAIRSTAFGVFAATGRFGAILGNVLFGQFIGLSVAIPMLITAGFLGVASWASLTLRETKDAVLK